MAKARTAANDQAKRKATPPPADPRQESNSNQEGHPKELPLDLVEEDPYQPRTVFDKKLLEELAQTVGQRGVKNPISVRHHPQKPGRYIINDGARRYRASLLAAKKTIKAFIDPDFTKIDQIIVNAHQADFTPREWAILIDQEEKKGKTRIQIAKELGKSPPFVTYYSTLLKLPDPIAEVFNSGRCEDVTALNQLLTVWKLYPAEVGLWLDDPTVEVTRASIKRLRAFLDSREQVTNKDEPSEGDEETQTAATERKTRTTDPMRLRKPVMQVRVEGRLAHLLYSRRPSQFGMAWIKFEEDGSEIESPLTDIHFVGLLEGV